MNIYLSTRIQKALINGWNEYIYQPGGNIYAFLNFSTPKSCILKQLQITIGGLLKISKVLINKQKATVNLKIYITIKVAQFHKYQSYGG